MTASKKSAQLHIAAFCATRSNDCSNHFCANCSICFKPPNHAYVLNATCILVMIKDLALLFYRFCNIPPSAEVMLKSIQEGKEFIKYIYLHRCLPNNLHFKVSTFLICLLLAFRQKFWLVSILTCFKPGEGRLKPVCQ